MSVAKCILIITQIYEIQFSVIIQNNLSQGWKSTNAISNDKQFYGPHYFATLSDRMLHKEETPKGSPKG